MSRKERHNRKFAHGISQIHYIILADIVKGKREYKLKTAKLTIGIVSIVFSLIVLFQSCAAGVGSALTNTNDTSGGSGIFVAILMIAAGIVGIAARASKGGSIAATIIYAIAGIVGVATNGIYKDLIVWGIVNFAFAIVFLISIFTQNYNKPVVPAAVPASTPVSIPKAPESSESSESPKQ